ncbi:MAG: FixH family protein [Acidobacteriota bacterium]|nr:FixH family protein [Acidobacteriota bacterium]
MKPDISRHALRLKTTAGRWTLVVFLALLLSGVAACGTRPSAEAEHEEEALARTEFTNRIENFFEYEPLKARKPSQFLIHLTDLTDGAPVEKAEVTLVTRAKGGAEVAQTKARVGKVTGIYVADVILPSAGEYDIEFRIKNEKIDERLPLSDFKVE